MMQYLEMKMKAFRNMCSTKPVSYLTHLEEAQSLVEKLDLVPGKRRTRRCTGSKLPWIISTIISTSLTLFLFVTRPSLNCASTSPVGSFETGFSTDLGRRPRRAELIKAMQMTITDACVNRIRPALDLN